MLKPVFGHQYFQLIEPRDMHRQFSVRLPQRIYEAYCSTALLGKNVARS
jgi:hypothetical protein